MVKAVPRKAPSRIKYEQAHPTVSCRVSRELYDRLQQTKEVECRSFADILKAGLGIMEKRARDTKAARSEGYEEGYAKAQGRYRITYLCNVCRKTIELNSEEEKRAASKYMEEHGWGHGECHERK